ncbi:MAG TPA: nickel pincer cofactor biosynthesis protein LarC [Chloroflexia bacterium]|nr:nickel pincer cofactor biosynthesis protein LarC [Chloroflexia bacterium]
MANILYFDAFSGVSGDMTVGALLHLGMPLDYLRENLASLKLPGYSLDARPVVQHHISGVKFDVILENPAEHEHRSLSRIEAIINDSNLPSRVKSRAINVFRALGEAEARIHNVPVEQIHFHEVGAVDAIVDIVGSCIGFEYFEIEEFFCGPLPAGSGFVRAAHGLMPVPAPATLQLLAQVGAVLSPSVTLSGGVEYPARGEMITPTGAALVATLCKMERPAIALQAAGYGFGTKEFAWPNALRLWLGQRVTSKPTTSQVQTVQVVSHTPSDPSDQSGHHHHHEPATEHHTHPHGHEHAAAESSPSHNGSQDSSTVEEVLSAQQSDLLQDAISLIESNLDDMTAEGLGFLMERLLAEGALDVFFTPIQMKKNRPATKLSVLARPADEARLSRLILLESSTFGVRCSRMSRYMAGREFAQVITTEGQVQVKLKKIGQRVSEAVPEYDSVTAQARRSGRPWRELYREALQAAEHLVKRAPK